MSILRRTFLVLALATSVGSAACSGSPAESVDDSDSDLSMSAAPLSDSALAAALASPPASLGNSRSDALMRATIRPVATTKRLKLLNDFIDAGMKKYPKVEAYDRLAAEMEGLYWGTPRDITFTPAQPASGGLTFQTTVDLSGSAGPTRLTVSGVAPKFDTKLELTIANTHVTIDRVPAGSTAAATAALIAAKIKSSNQSILNTINAKNGFAPIGGDHADAVSGVDDIEVSVSGNTVVILVAQNG